MVDQYCRAGLAFASLPINKLKSSTTWLLTVQAGHEGIFVSWQFEIATIWEWDQRRRCRRCGWQRWRLCLDTDEEEHRHPHHRHSRSLPLLHLSLSLSCRSESGVPQAKFKIKHYFCDIFTRASFSFCWQNCGQNCSYRKEKRLILHFLLSFATNFPVKYFWKSGFFWQIKRTQV